MLASPSSLSPDGPIAPIDLPAEVRSLRRAWDAQVGRGLLDVTILGRLPEALAIELRRDGYRVRQEPATLATFADLLPGMHGLHLISHGAFKNGVASLLWEDEQGGATIVSELDFLPKVRNSTLRLVFLQACRTAAGASTAMSGLAPQVAARTAAVVAMQDYVRMDDASRFAEQFYDTLLTTGYVDRAVNAGRQALFTAAPGTSNWAIPCLYLAPKSARLWRPDQVLRAVQDLADKFRALPEISQPFPVEVIRLQDRESPRMETSPPGPRVRVLDAVAAALAADGEGHGAVAGHRRQLRTGQDLAAALGLRQLCASGLPRRHAAAALPAGQHLSPRRRPARAPAGPRHRGHLREVRRRAHRDRCDQAAGAAVPAVRGRRRRRRRPPAAQGLRVRAGVHAGPPAGRRGRSPSTSSSWPGFARSTRRFRSWWCSCCRRRR